MRSANGLLRCDGCDCTVPPTHIGEKGFIYCASHAAGRQQYERCRRMRAWEIRLLRTGKPLPSYRPVTLAEYAALAAKEASNG